MYPVVYSQGEVIAIHFEMTGYDFGAIENYGFNNTACFLTKLCLEYAERLLSSGEFSIEQTAYKSSFTVQNILAKLLKKPTLSTVKPVFLQIAVKAF